MMEKKRNGALCLWAFIFSMVLVVHYAYLMRPEAADRYPLLFYRGELALDFFFVLAGVMLARRVNSVPKEAAFEWKELGVYLKEILRKYLPALVIIWAVTFTAVNIAYYNDAKTLFNNFFASLLELLPIRSAGIRLKTVSNTSIAGSNIMDQAWVFSALIIAVVFIYPLYRKNKERFEFFIAPAAALILIGYAFFKGGNLVSDSMRMLDAKYLFYTFKSTVEALGEICLGVVCYQLGEMLGQKKLSKPKIALLTVVEIGAYLGVLVYMQYYRWVPRYTDFLALAAIAVGVTLSYSRQGAFSRICDNGFFRFLGRFSLYPFLTFILVAKILPLYMPKAGTLRLEIVYLALTLASALILMALEKPFVKLVKASKKLIIKPQPLEKKESA